MAGAEIVYVQLKNRVEEALPGTSTEAISTKRIAEKLGMDYTGGRGSDELSRIADALRALRKAKAVDCIMGPPQSHGRRSLWYRI